MMPKPTTSRLLSLCLTPWATRRSTIYYYKTQNATVDDPTNKWQTRIFIGDREIEPALLKAKNDKNEVLYINKFGQLSADPAAVDPTFNPNAAHPKYALDEQKTKVASQAGSWTGGFMQNGATSEARTSYRSRLTATRPTILP